MAYAVQSKKSGQTYYLHSRPSSNGKTKVYFFAREVKEGAMDELPRPAEAVPVLAGLAG